MEGYRVAVVDDVGDTVIEVELGILGVADSEERVSVLGLRLGGKVRNGIEQVARYLAGSSQRVDVGAPLHGIGGVEIGAVEGIAPCA